MHRFERRGGRRANSHRFGLVRPGRRKKYGLWGEDNNRLTREQLLNPTSSPDGSGLPTPFAVATIEKNRKDSKEDKQNMSDQPKSVARQRAADLIFDFKARSGAFKNLNKPRGDPACGG